MGSTNTRPLASVVIAPSASIAEAMAQLDRAGTGALVVCSSGRKPSGLLTDGDVRRALLREVQLHEPCGTIANAMPIVSTVPLLPTEARQFMERHDISHLPILNAQGELVDFLLRGELGTEEELAARTKSRLEQVLISPDSSIMEAIAQLDKAGTGALVLCTGGQSLYGVLTDGDIRRAVLRGVSLQSACGGIASRNPTTAQFPVSAVDALASMSRHDINHMPVVDAEHHVVDFLLRNDLVSDDELNLSAVIMAGGFGKRLFPLTAQVPKPMLPVGDRPLLERTIAQLRQAGIQEVTLTTHYLSDNIERHFGDGASVGVRLNYLKEDHPMGTAGGLRAMRKATGPFLVMNGDILTGLPFREMLAYHRQNRADMTVGVRKYEVRVPFGVVQCDETRITRLEEKPSVDFLINAGIYLLEPRVCDYIPEGQRFDMTELIQKLLDSGRPVVSFPIVEYWLDMGQHADYSQANEDVRKGKI